MEWLILFVVSWAIFIPLADWKNLKRNIWCGLLAVALQLTIDTQAANHGYYEIRKHIFHFLGSPLLFDLGPVLTIGILIAQKHPEGRKLRIANVFAIASLYSLQELLLIARGNVVYTNWSFIDSVQVNISVMIILSWFIMIVLKKGSTD